MKDFFMSVAGFMVLILFIAFSLWLGTVVLIMALIAGGLYFLYLKTRVYLFRWYYGRVFNATQPPEKPYKEAGSNVFYDAKTKTTIIDVEYEDISGKK